MPPSAATASGNATTSPRYRHSHIRVGSQGRLPRRPKSEVQAQVVLRVVARAARGFADLHAVRDPHRDPGADGRAVRSPAHALDGGPAARGRRLVPQQRRRVVDMVRHDIHATVIVEIAAGAAAPHLGRRDAGSGLVGDVAEADAAQVAIQDLPLPLCPVQPTTVQVLSGLAPTAYPGIRRMARGIGLARQALRRADGGRTVARRVLDVA